MYACKTGRLDILILLQSFGASLVITDEDGASCLSLAVRHGHAQIIDYLVSTHRVNINAKNPITGCTALMLAACRGDTAMTAHLLTYQHYNIDVDASSFIASTTNSYTPSSAAMKGNTALHIAAHRGHFDVVKLLVRDGGCDLSLRNLKGETAVLVAVKQNRIKIVRFLMDYSYNLQSQHHHQIMSPSLTETATSHDIRSSPPPPSSTSSTTNVAASPSSTTIALAQSHFFINNIANHEVAAKVDGSTTILARSSSSSSGSSSSSSDHSSTYSSSDDQSADSSHLILINDSDFKGWTALIWAAFMGNYELVQILVNNYGADVNIKGDDLIRKSSGGTSSVVTSSDLSPFSPDFSNSLETPQSPPVSATLTSGGNGGGGGGIHVNGMFAGRTALQTACRRGHTDIARFLLRSGADVHLKTSKGETALMFAAGSSSSSSSSHTTAVTSSTGFGLVQEMVEVWGADVRCAESVTGRTAYHFALDQGKAEVAKYLRDKMIYNSGGGGGKGTIAGSGNGISSLVDSGYDASSVVGDDQSSYFRDRIHSTSSTTTSHRSQENQDLECAICLEAFTENPGDFFYECDHRYHHKCYVGWRSTLTNVNNRINFSCPKCQRIELVI